MHALTTTPTFTFDPPTSGTASVSPAALPTGHFVTANQDLLFLREDHGVVVDTKRTEGHLVRLLVPIPEPVGGFVCIAEVAFGSTVLSHWQVAGGKLTPKWEDYYGRFLLERAFSYSPQVIYIVRVWWLRGYWLLRGGTYRMIIPLPFWGCGTLQVSIILNSKSILIFLGGTRIHEVQLPNSGMYNCAKISDTRFATLTPRNCILVRSITNFSFSHQSTPDMGRPRRTKTYTTTRNTHIQHRTTLSPIVWGDHIYSHPLPVQPRLHHAVKPGNQRIRIRKNFFERATQDMVRVAHRQNLA